MINRNLLLLHFLYIKLSYELSWDLDLIYKNFLISFQFSAILYILQLSHRKFLIKKACKVKKKLKIISNQEIVVPILK